MKQFNGIIRIRDLIFLAAVTAIMLSGAPDVRSKGRSPSEYQVKAAFLYNFPNFVEWPAESFADSSAPVIIGVLGKNPFRDALDLTVKDKTVNGRKLTVKYFSELSNLEPCHILFISSSERRRLGKIQEAIKNWSVLTVGEMEGFTSHGGIINFVVENNKIGLEVNVDNAKQARLKISSKLLKLAKIVRN